MYVIGESLLMPINAFDFHPIYACSKSLICYKVNIELYTLP